MRCGIVGGMRVLTFCIAALAVTASAEPPRPSTFSIVGADPGAHEVGVAVASRFFSVGSVVPHARANAGAVATQANANVAFGEEGLALLQRGLLPDEVVRVLLRKDEGRARRQLGVVALDGRSATYSGDGCTPWAGGRSGPGYAVQGNILTGPEVVAAMEASFLGSQGKPLAIRLVEALAAGDAAGGDSRGRQSAAVYVVRERAGFNGYTDQAVDVRVDDHPSPIEEIRRLTRMGVVNDGWNRAWTAFTEKRFPDALTWQEKTAALAVDAPGVRPEILYDLAVIRLANGDEAGALTALGEAIAGNPKLAEQARKDADLATLRPRLGELSK